MRVDAINELFMQWKEETLEMERAVGQLLQYAVLHEQQLKGLEERVQHITAQQAAASKRKRTATPRKP